MIVYDLTRNGYRVFDSERPDDTIAILDELDMACVLMGDLAGSTKYTEDETRKFMRRESERKFKELRQSLAIAIEGVSRPR